MRKATIIELCVSGFIMLIMGVVGLHYLVDSMRPEHGGSFFMKQIERYDPPQDFVEVSYEGMVITLDKDRTAQAGFELTLPDSVETVFYPSNSFGYNRIKLHFQAGSDTHYLQHAAFVYNYEIHMWQLGGFSFGEIATTNK